MEKGAEIIISFAGDVALARGVLNYLSSHHVISNNIMTELAGDEIRISLKRNYDTKMNKLIKHILHNYFHSHNLTRHQITELNDILIVGIPKHIDEISNFFMCEICGWMVTSEEELLTHRRTHGI
jgi:D-hexose-6-phosphate mutarotase